MKQSFDFRDFVDEVISKTDIVDLVSQYVTLKRVGDRFQGLCPLHNDKKTPSFSVSADKQLFHCFGCGAGGTAIHFVMKKENLDFTEALKLLAERAGIPFPDERGRAGGASSKAVFGKKKRMYAMNADAARWFFGNLTAECGKEALKYLKGRGLKNSTIKSFGLGYAQNSWSALIDFMKTKGYTESELCEGGLAVKRDNGTFFDKFRDRVMFPIFDIRGNVIGFGGRIMADRDSAPKYLNSPETLVFKKKENLFAMNIAKNSKSGQFLLMEGYMDVISLHQNGFDNAVASLGTAFTPQQAEILKRYADKAVLCYDADEAGQKATARAGDILRDAGIKAKVISITDGKDPDEYINAKGKEMFGLLIDNAQSFTEYKISKIEEQYNLEDSVEKLEFIEQIAKIFANIKNDVEREIYIKATARKTDISAESINAQVKDIMRKNQRTAQIKSQNDEKRQFEERTGGRKDMDKMRLYNAESLMLNLLCEKEIYKAVSQRLSPEDFSEGLHRRLAQVLYNIHQNGEEFKPMSVIAQFDERDAGRVSQLIMDDKNVADKKSAANQTYKIINEYRLKKASMSEETDAAKLQEIMDKLKKEKKQKGEKL